MLIINRYRAMALLERALSISPANFHLKIILVRVYLEAGLINAASYIFFLLDAKQIQIDSLGFLHVPLLAPLGQLTVASSALDHAVKFFVANYKHVNINTSIKCITSRKLYYLPGYIFCFRVLIV